MTLRRKPVTLEHYILSWLCVIGLCLGSFFNVVILRSLSNESIIFPASKCPKCGNKLYWWHNIPVLSYLMLRGKCYFCKEKISIQYPIIELGTMFLFAISFLKFGISWKTLFVIIWLSGLVIMTATDLKAKLVDCNIAIILAVSGLVYNLIFSDLSGGVNSILGLAAGALILEIIARSGYIFAGTRAMGEADTYVAAALGAMFGIHNILWILLYGLIASMIFIVPVFLYNQYKNNNKVICILAVLFILTVLVYYKLCINFWVIGILIFLGILLSISILKNIRKEENRNYLPYVPALAFGALYFIFFSTNF